MEWNVDLIDHILYKMFKVILGISSKSMGMYSDYTMADNPSIRRYINKIENRIIFEIKAGYYPEILSPESMKLLGSTKITKDEYGENAPHLEITEVVLVRYNNVNNNY